MVRYSKSHRRIEEFRSLPTTHHKSTVSYKSVYVLVIRFKKKKKKKKEKISKIRELRTTLLRATDVIT